MSKIQQLRERITLSLVHCGDTVNTWRAKINAIIDMVNGRDTHLSSVHYGATPPSSVDFGLWYNTEEDRLYAWNGQFWVLFHNHYVSEVRLFEKVITTDKFISPNFNGIAVSPTIAHGVTVEIADGSELTIL